MSMRKVCLELTDACNLNCTMCYRHSWIEKTQHMPKEMVERILTQIEGIESIDEIVVGGIGEPSIHPQIIEVLERLKSYKVSLTTNAVSLTESMREAIVEYVDQLVISIDGLAQHFYEIRGISLEGVLEQVKLINELKKKQSNQSLQLIFQMVLSATNKEDVFGIIDLASEYGVSQLIISNILPVSLEDSDLCLYSISANEQMAKYYDQVRIYAIRRGLAIRLSENRLKTERRCRFVDNDTIVINAHGKIAPCYRFAHEGTEVVFGRLKTIQAHTFGDVLEEDLESIWHSKAYTDYRYMVYNNHYPSCTDCDLVDGCDMVSDTYGDCYGNAPSCGDCLWVRNLVYCI
ncbi:radical SAM protein [Fusibacter ferrireducens]|uniref:Radical SAM protein n=1 Tax=Fusibacter ferrireducens TaxID=2785058 RepID=A0ABR9ZR65_9FIRM|nr:radical SAM protein [Fusibacter ferrireducens]MBF4692919.1 radical SAM protein [Fusibacter ferrireducens]